MDNEGKIDEAVKAVMDAIKLTAKEPETVLNSLQTKSILIESQWRSFFEDLFED